MEKPSLLNNAFTLHNKTRKKTYLGFNITIKILNNEPQTIELEMGEDFKLEK
jgi:hypothetical protein